MYKVKITACLLKRHRSDLANIYSSIKRQQLRLTRAALA